jgi:DNA-directed RNA polymerase subunit RPC12/RpoP
MSTPLASVTGSDVPYSCFDAAQESQSVAHQPRLRSYTPGAKSKLYPCKRCGRAYMWKKTLLRHVRMECGKEPQFQCPYCPQKSKLKGNLKQHIMSKHVTFVAEYNRRLPLWDYLYVCKSSKAGWVSVIHSVIVMAHSCTLTGQVLHIFNVIHLTLSENLTTISVVLGDLKYLISEHKS